MYFLENFINADGKEKPFPIFNFVLLRIPYRFHVLVTEYVMSKRTLLFMRFIQKFLEIFYTNCTVTVDK